MAESADALDSGSSELTLIQVQVLLSAPKTTATRVNRASEVVFYFAGKELNLGQRPAIRTKNHSHARKSSSGCGFFMLGINFFKSMLDGYH